MSRITSDGDFSFRDAIDGLKAGDFSRLEPLFHNESADQDRHCQIVEWHQAGRFADEPTALQEALTCACFLGRTAVVEYFLTRGVSPSAGDGTGLNGFHWAANRGQLETVRLLIHHQAALETRSMYGGTVLGTAVYAAVNEPRADHLRIIEALLKAGACFDEAGYPTGNERLDEVLKPYQVSA